MSRDESSPVPAPEEARSKPLDLREQMLDMIAHAAGPDDMEDPAVAEAKKKLDDRYYEFFKIKPITLPEFAQEHPDYFHGTQFNHFLSDELMNYRPPHEFLLAMPISPEDRDIEGSRNKSFADQLAMVRAHSQNAIEPTVPNAGAIMLPATVLAQADYQFIQNNALYHSRYFTDRSVDDGDIPNARLLMNRYTYTTERSGISGQITLGRYARRDPLEVKSARNEGAVNLVAVHGVVINKTGGNVK